MPEISAPYFHRSKLVDLSFATTGFCQARCNCCIWPYMVPTGKVMSDELFSGILEKFNGYRIGELVLNIINEPFTDKSINNKIRIISNRPDPIEKFFFSSNWLIPNDEILDDFFESTQACCASEGIQLVQINATLSGIDQKSYDIQQAGAELSATKKPYQPLDFQKAVANVCGIITRLSTLNVHDLPKLRFIIKAYGDFFSQEEMTLFWMDQLRSQNISELFIQRHVKILLNHCFTSFARESDISKYGELKCCQSAWLEKRLVIGPDGQVGLCCEDGLRQIVVGSLKDNDVQGLIESLSFQKNLRIVRGLVKADQEHPCTGRAACV